MIDLFVNTCMQISCTIRCIHTATESVSNNLNSATLFLTSVRNMIFQLEASFHYFSCDVTFRTAMLVKHSLCASSLFQ